MNALSSQNEEMDPEKVEVMIDATQETFSLGDDWGVQRRHRGEFWSSECWESEGLEEDPLAATDSFRT
jgi:hypothetical protein